MDESSRTEEYLRSYGAFKKNISISCEKMNGKELKDGYHALQFFLIYVGELCGFGEIPEKELAELAKHCVPLGRAMWEAEKEDFLKFAKEQGYD